VRNLCAFANFRLTQLLCGLILAIVAAEFAFLGYYEGRSRGGRNTSFGQAKYSGGIIDNAGLENGLE